MPQPVPEPTDLHTTNGKRTPASRWQASVVAQTATFVLFDVAIIWVSTILAYFVRFEGAIPVDFAGIIAPVALVASVIFPTLFAIFGLYGYIWRYVGVPALVRLGWVTALGWAMMLILDLWLAHPPLYRPVPLGTLIIFGVLVFLGFFVIRVFGRLMAYVQAMQTGADARRVLIVGAGNAGSLLVRDIENNPAMNVRVVGFVDDDPAKHGRFLGRSRVLGSTEQIEVLVGAKDVDEIWVAIPTADPADMRRILYDCGKARTPVKIVPSMAGSKQNVGVVDLENVQLEDFLNREPIVTDESAVDASVRGRRVLVTGAAGSIGAELCRQVALHGPARLSLLEVDESRLYEVFLEIRDIAPEAAAMVLCDIRDRSKMHRVFAAELPDIVIHAAAYKHVPLMEMEPDEAVRSNIQGTKNVLECCAEQHVGEFTLISTDKAVMPKSVMGATKRAAERMAIDAARKGLGVTIVRFGNVLGSRGSVIPVFDGALQRGDVVRITDPEVTRYFMTIPEAVQLVLQARVLSDGTDLFVLDMGEPVRVLDLAQALIELRGGQAQVEFSGLRPAEKMHEILVTSEEALIPTTCAKVMRATALPFVDSGYGKRADDVVIAARGADPEDVREMLASLVPEYRADDGPE